MRPHNRFRHYFLLTVLLALVAGYAVAHIVSLFVPPTLYTLCTSSFERSTGKKILIRSIRFHVFRGASFEGVVIYDDHVVIARAKTVSAHIIFSPLLRGKVIIPFIKVESPTLLVERRADGTLNLADLLPRTLKPGVDLPVSIRRLVIKRGRVWFVDRAPEPDYKHLLENVSADIRFSLPVRLSYTVSFDVPGTPKAAVQATGDYVITQGRLKAQMTVDDLPVTELTGYLGAQAWALPGGVIDATATLIGAGGKADITAAARVDDLIVASPPVRTKLDAYIKVHALYDAATKGLQYAGTADVGQMELTGLEPIGTVRDIAGTIGFDRTRVWSERLACTALGIPWNARVNLIRSAEPILDIYAGSDTLLGAFQKTLAEECALRLPVDLAGDAHIEVAISFEGAKSPKVNGYLRVRDATARLGNGIYPVEHITGEAHFTPQEIEWTGVKLAYRDTSYITSGVVTNFSSPGVRLTARSADLSFSSMFNMSGPVITLTELKGNYLHSLFSATGSIDLSDQTNVAANVRGSVELSLRDVRTAASRTSGVRKMRPAGKVYAEFALSGGMKHLELCTLHAKVKSPRLSLYGARLADVALEYVQSGGVGELKSIESVCYGGTLKACGEINWRAKAQPFTFTIDARDIMLERLKSDTGFKDADVAGDLKVYARLNGYFKDFTRLQGLGRIAITDGKLWELNLFRGLGTAIFTRDFKSIVFSDGSCDFRIDNQAFLADSLELKSAALRLSGAGRFGFDKSLDAVMRPELTEDAMLDASDAQYAFASAIQEGTAVRIGGTFQDPTFKTTTDVAQVIGAILNPD